MSLSAWVWRRFLDPVVLRIERRMAHFQDQRQITHGGEGWGDRARIGKGVIFYPEAQLTNSGVAEQLVVGDFCCIRGEILALGKGRCELGHHSFLGPGSRIWCSESVTIGSHVLISHLVDIHDSNSHSMDWRQRREEGVGLFERGEPQTGEGVATRPVTIEDDVWLGFKSSILPGITIGRGAVVAACSVVTKDVAPFTLVAGNPARVVRELPQ